MSEHSKPQIALKPAKSSNVAAHGYDAASKTLAVRFKGGGTYHYAGVPPEVAEKFGSADSMGQFFASNIRNKFAGDKQ